MHLPSRKMSWKKKYMINRRNTWRTPEMKCFSQSQSRKQVFFSVTLERGFCFSQSHWREAFVFLSHTLERYCFSQSHCRAIVFLSHTAEMQCFSQSHCREQLFFSVTLQRGIVFLSHTAERHCFSQSHCRKTSYFRVDRKERSAPSFLGLYLCWRELVPLSRKIGTHYHGGSKKFIEKHRQGQGQKSRCKTTLQIFFPLSSEFWLRRERMAIFALFMSWITLRTFVQILLSGYKIFDLEETVCSSRLEL